MNPNKHLHIQFDFHEDGSTSEPLLFSNPVELITATQPSEVPCCLSQMEAAVERGYYVAGYISYEALDHLHHHSTNTMPLLHFGIFHAPDKTDKDNARADFTVGEWQLMESYPTYKSNVEKIIEAIKQGEIEEINYTVPFEAHFSGNAFTYYHQLKQAQQSNYCAYLSMDGFDILSASPELFFQTDKEQITVRPMKGTIHRGLTYEEDMKQRAWLQSSDKNKKENKIILDLMKEELKKTSVEGSVRPVDTYRIEQYPTVYQMTSGLKGTLTKDTSIVDALQTLFPCGSIAGVPKNAGLEWIRTLESQPREVYCGTMGYITPDKKAVFNVPIRTVWIDRDKEIAHYGAGGAITIHSTAEEEFREVQTKANILTWKQPDFELLETIGLSDGKYFILSKHLKRLQASADYFNIEVDLVEIEEQLQQVKKEHPNGHWRVRLTVNQIGESHITVTPTEALSTTPFVSIADMPIDKHHRFLYHKTTHREAHNTHKIDNVFDVLLWNQDEEVTEFTIGNLVVQINGALYTPPVSSGLLPGTFRAQLIEAGTIKEKKLFKKDIEHSEHLWLINSVRKWVEVILD